MNCTQSLTAVNVLGETSEAGIALSVVLTGLDGRGIRF
jgi:hypothetical protein